MRHVPVDRVDLMYPARTDGNGVTWYRPADGGEGWTALPEFAHPSYFHPNALVLQTATPSRKEKK